MKNLIIATSLALGLATVAIAQPSPEVRQARAAQFAEQRVERLAEQLSLTPAQKLEVEALFTQQAQARRELAERHRGESQALREQAETQLGQVLTAEQLEQWQAVRSERAAAWEGKRHGHGRRGPASKR